MSGAWIDAGHPAASLFLWIAGLGFLFGLALPMLIAPLRWARWFQWPQAAVAAPGVAGVAGVRQLTVYFGRSLGAVAVAFLWICLRAAPDPTRSPLVWEGVIIACLLLLLVHVAGALRRAQPWTENLEIVVYLGAGAAAVWFYLTLF